MRKLNSVVKNLLLLVVALFLIFGLTACKKDKDDGVLQELQDIKELFMIGDLSRVVQDFDLPKKASSHTTVVDVRWVSSHKEIIEITQHPASSDKAETHFLAKVTQPKTKDPVKVTLTATLHLGSKSVDKEFYATVIPGATLLNVKHSPDGTKFSLEATVIYTHFTGYYVYDGTSVMSVYQPPVDSKQSYDLSVGSEIKISGVKTTAFGITPQIDSGAVTSVIDPNKGFDVAKLAQKSSVKDILELDRSNPDSFAQILTITGKIVDGGDRARRAIETDDGVIWIFNNTEGRAELDQYKDKDQEVELTILIHDYHTGNNYWRVLYFENTLKEVESKPATDEEKLAYAVSSLNESYKNRSTISDLDLPTVDSRYEDVTISWVSSDKNIISDNGKLGNITKDETVTLTATLKIGDLEEILEFEITVILDGMTIADARAAVTADEEKHDVMFKGIIIGLDDYGYFVADETGVVYVREVGHTREPGDEVAIIGKISIYFGSGGMSSATQYGVQIDSANKDEFSIETLSKGNKNPLPEPIEMTVGEIAKLENTLEAALSASFYGKAIKVTGVINEVMVGNNRNLYLFDGDDKISVHHHSLDSSLAQLELLLGKEVTLVLIPDVLDKSTGWRSTLLDASYSIGHNLTEEEILAFIESEIEIIAKDNSGVYFDLDFISKSKYNLLFPNVVITWESSNPEVIANDGTVTRHASEDKEVVVVVKVYLEDDVVVLEKTITITVYSLEKGSEIVEDFSTFDDVFHNYNNGTFVGVGGITWEYKNARTDLTHTDGSEYIIDGNGLMFGNTPAHSSGGSSLKATISGGISSFKIDTLKAFKGSGQRKIEILVNGKVYGEFVLNNSDTNVQVFEITNINISGTFTLEIRQAGTATNRSQITLDNITWTGYAE